MTVRIADDVVAIRARLEELEQEKVAARLRRQAEDKSFEDSPFSVPIPDISDIYC